MRAVLQCPKEQMHREKKKATRKLKMPFNQHASRQPASQDALRWLSARSAEGVWRSFFEGAGFILSPHLTFSFDEP